MAIGVRSITANWKLKLLACALAVLLWVVVSAEEVTSNTISLPLEVQMLDPDHRLVASSAPDEVRVRFVGPGRELLDLAYRRPPVVLRVEEVDDPEEVFELEPSMVQLPNGLAVNPQDVQPRTVSLSFVAMGSRRVPVRVRLAADLPQGWALADSLRTEPSTVRVSGPVAALDDVQALATLPLALTPDDTAFSATVPLDTDGLRGLSVTPAAVRVSGSVDRVDDLTFVDVPISLGDGVRVRPQTVNVQLRGVRQRLARVQRGDFRVVVAIDSIPGRIPPDGLAVPLRVEQLPPGLEAAPNPRTVRLFRAAAGGDGGLPGVPVDTAGAGVP